MITKSDNMDGFSVELMLKKIYHAIDRISATKGLGLQHR